MKGSSYIYKDSFENRSHFLCVSLDTRPPQITFVHILDLITPYSNMASVTLAMAWYNNYYQNFKLRKHKQLSPIMVL